MQIRSESIASQLDETKQEQKTTRDAATQTKPGFFTEIIPAPQKPIKIPKSKFGLAIARLIRNGELFWDGKRMPPDEIAIWNERERCAKEGLAQKQKSQTSSAVITAALTKTETACAPKQENMDDTSSKLSTTQDNSHTCIDDMTDIGVAAGISLSIVPLLIGALGYYSLEHGKEKDSKLTGVLGCCTIACSCPPGSAGCLACGVLSCPGLFCPDKDAPQCLKDAADFVRPMLGKR